MSALAESGYSCASTAIVIWVEAPWKVLATDQLGIFGYPQHELVGETVEKLAGPLSDFSLFQHAIVSTTSHRYSKIQLVLYSKSGKEMQVSVSCEPLMYGGIFVGCLAIFQPFQAVTLQKVLGKIAESRCAQCLVSSDSPHEIQACNEAFVNRFGFSGSDALGQPVTLLASLIHGSGPLFWSSLVLAAGDGAILRRSISVSGAAGAQDGVTAFEEAIFVPVVEAHSISSVRHVLIIFPPSYPPVPLVAPPASPLRRASWFPRGGSKAFVPGAAAHCANVLAHPGSTPVAVSTAGLAHAVLQPRGLAQDLIPGAAGCKPALCRLSPVATPDTSPEIRPRRRIVPSISGAEGITPLTVVFTPALLEDLRGQPLPAAARSIGVSATAFKRACRRLGLPRWPFHRGPARGRKGDRGASSSA